MAKNINIVVKPTAFFLLAALLVMLGGNVAAATVCFSRGGSAHQSHCPKAGGRVYCPSMAMKHDADTPQVGREASGQQCPFRALLTKPMVQSVQPSSQIVPAMSGIVHHWAGVLSSPKGMAPITEPQYSSPNDLHILQRTLRI